MRDDRDDECCSLDQLADDELDEDFDDESGSLFANPSGLDDDEDDEPITCGACGAEVFEGDEACDECGVPIDWTDEDFEED